MVHVSYPWKLYKDLRIQNDSEEISVHEQMPTCIVGTVYYFLELAE